MTKKIDGFAEYRVDVFGIGNGDYSLFPDEKKGSYFRKCDEKRISGRKNIYFKARQ